MSQVNHISPAVTPQKGSEDTNTSLHRPALTSRKSSSLHLNVIKKLRPLPFQYVWAVWHDKAASCASASYDERLTLLAEAVPDIGSFYRIYNNFPWENVKIKDSVHVFRSGVKPLWEDKENLEGGSLTVKVKREEGKAIKAWEELCLMACGGELQAAVQNGTSQFGFGLHRSLEALNLLTWLQNATIFLDFHTRHDFMSPTSMSGTSTARM